MSVNYQPLFTTLGIQTSAQGGVIPLLWGTTRISGNLIWYNDFIAHAIVDRQRGGKGMGGSGGTTNVSYDYTVSYIMGLCHGPVESINLIFQDTAKYAFNQAVIDNRPASATFANGTPSITSNDLTALLGGPDQYQWSYFSTAHLEEGLHYRGIASVAAANFGLGSATTLPALSFEVQGGNLVPGTMDCNPAFVLADFLSNPVYGVNAAFEELMGDFSSFEAYCAATDMLVSPSITRATSAQDWLDGFLSALNCDVFVDQGRLEVVPRGDTAIGDYAPVTEAVYDLTVDDFMGPETQAGSYSASIAGPIQIMRAAKASIVNSVSVEYIDRNNDYNTAVVTAQDDASIALNGLLTGDSETCHFFTTAAAAQMSASLRLGRKQIQNSYTFGLGQKYILLQPADIVTLTYEPFFHRLPVKITQIQEQSDSTLLITAEDYPSGIGSAPLYGREAPSGYIPNYNLDPGGLLPPLIFEPPQSLGQGTQLWFALCGADRSAWGGCVIMASADGETYDRIGTITGWPNLGIVGAPLPAVAAAPGGGPSLDAVNTLTADLLASGGTLSTTSEANAQALGSLCYVGGEYIAFANATPIGPNMFGLTYLLRGAHGSEIEAHAVNEKFVLLDQAIFRWTYDPLLVGATIHFKFLSFNIYGGGQVQLSEATEYAVTISGEAGPASVSQINQAIANAANAAASSISNVGYGYIYGDDQTELNTVVSILESSRSLDRQARLLANWTAGFVNYQTAQAMSQGAYAVNIETVYAVASNKTVYVQPNAPEGSFDALWINTAEKNAVYSWNGLSWVLARPGEEADNLITALITTEQIARISADDALASSITTLSTSVGGQFASVSTTLTAHTSSINGIEASYAVEVNANNHVSGFKLISNASRSDFIIDVDYFAIAATGYGNQYVFTVGTIGGVAAVGIHGNLVVDGTITSAPIAANAITNNAGAQTVGNNVSVNIYVRAGMRITVLVSTSGWSANGTTAGTLDISVNGSTVQHYNLSSVTIAASSTVGIIFPYTAIYTFTAGSTGVMSIGALLTISASGINPQLSILALGLDR